MLSPHTFRLVPALIRKSRDSHVCNVRVAGSNPVSCSILKKLAASNEVGFLRFASSSSWPGRIRRPAS